MGASTPYNPKFSELYRDLLVTLDQNGVGSTLRLTKKALAHGKLGFYSCSAFSIGEEATIHANLYGKAFDAVVRVTDCCPKKDLYMIELEMVEDIAFQARIFLQLAAIANYKEACDCDGRCLTIDEAAFEWIEEHAESFAEEFESRVNDSVI
ncbi:Uncharacterised protein [BD1-7 clade bacterium]|uniref:Uncharacterized protein n=1 Tax=BD1-7 clade bacterium TaxID=2029982 RepID=A0A5S9QHJ0_9GAMM|nr:Uncharacterised protein [BD1-7 clade bacterium]CAA0116920.1 Uncharacterised protein [BD1-7 clade bacterium]CAA0124937.1 Uncharacterised protein [BD1-7 clade bacterium]